MPHRTTRGVIPDDGPFIRTVPFGRWATATGTRLSAAARETLRAISMRQRLPAGTVLFSQGGQADWVFNVIDGIAVTERLLPDGRRRVLAFIASGDVCGLARRGVYVNTVTATTAVTVLRIPVEVLKALMLRNADLQFAFLCKITHVVRESQRQLLLLSCRDPIERVALFVSMMRHTLARGTSPSFAMPASMEQIASFLDLGPNVARDAFRHLSRRGVVRRNGHRLTVAPRLLEQFLNKTEPVRPRTSVRQRAETRPRRA